MTTSPDGAHATSELKVVERRFGPIPEEEFDPDRFLDGPRETDTRRDPYAVAPTLLTRFHGLPFAIGILGLIVGTTISLGTLRKGGRDHPGRGARLDGI